MPPKPETRTYPAFTKSVRLSTKLEWHRYLGCDPHPINESVTVKQENGALFVTAVPKKDEHGKPMFTPAFEVKLYDEQKQMPYCTGSQCWCGAKAVHDDGQCDYHGAPWKALKG